MENLDLENGKVDPEELGERESDTAICDFCMTVWDTQWHEEEICSECHIGVLIEVEGIIKSEW